MDQHQRPDDELASELRQTAGAEWSAEAAEDERLTELLRRRRMTLNDVAKELANRGDRVQVDFGGHSFSGAVVGAGEDYVVITGGGQLGEIRLERARWSVLTAEGPQVERIEVPESFKASLHQHAESGSMVRLTLDGDDMLIGKIAVVADDHLEVTDADDRSVYVSLDLVLGLIRSSDFQ